MRIKIRHIILAMILVFIFVWVGALIKNEILTHKYYDDFKYAYRSNTMLGDMEYFKVLKCNGSTAQVYYVSKNKTAGTVLDLKKTKNGWAEKSWRTIWSTTGSASDVIWPYWWQFVHTGF